MTSLQDHFLTQFKLNQARITPINNLIDSFNQAQSELEDIKSKYNSIEKEKSFLEKEVSHLKLTAAHAATVSPEILTENKELETKVNNLQEELIGFYKKKSNSDDEIKKLNKKLEKLEFSNNSKSLEIEKLKDLCFNKQNKEISILKSHLDSEKKLVKEVSSELDINNQAFRALEKKKTQLDIDYTSAVEQLLKYKNIECDQLDKESEHFRKIKVLENDNEKLKGIIKNCNCSRLLFGFEKLDFSSFVGGGKNSGSSKNSPENQRQRNVSKDSSNGVGIPPGTSPIAPTGPAGLVPGSLGGGLANNKIPTKLVNQKIEEADVHAIAMYNGILSLGYSNSLVKLSKNDKILSKFTDSTAQVNSLEFSSDGQYLLDSSNDFACCIWRTDTKRLFSRLTGHVEKVLAARFMNKNTQYDNFQIISGSKDRTMRLWELDRSSQFKCLRTFMTASMCQDVAVVNNYVVVSGYYDNTVRLHDTRHGREQFKSPKLDGKIVSLQTDNHANTHNGQSNEVFISTNRGSINRFDLRQQQIVDTFTDDNLSIATDFGMKMALSQDGLLAVGSTDKSTFLFDVSNGESLNSGFLKRIECLDVPLSYCWDEENRRLYCGMRNKKFAVYE